jgi:hypothetical protein
MLLSTDIYGIHTEQRTSNGRKSDIKLHINIYIHNNQKTFLKNKKKIKQKQKKKKKKKNWTLMRRLCPLEVSTKSFVSVTL